MSDCKIIINVEAKTCNYGSMDNYNRFAPRMQTYVEKLHEFLTQRHNKTILSSFDHQFMSLFDAYQSKTAVVTKLMYLLWTDHANQNGEIEFPTEDETDKWGIGPNLPLQFVNKNVVERFQARGQAVSVYPDLDEKESPELWQRVNELCADMLCSDKPVEAGRYFEENQTGFT